MNQYPTRGGGAGVRGRGGRQVGSTASRSNNNAGVEGSINVVATQLETETPTPEAVHKSSSSGQKRRRTEQVFESEEAALVSKAQRTLLEEKNRWNVFLTHNHLEGDRLIREVYGPKDINNLAEWLIGKTKVGENCRTWKANLLKNLKANVKTVMEAHPEWQRLSEQDLRKQVFQIMDASTFEAVWNYMSKILDYNRSKPLGQYYIKSIYASLFVVSKKEKDLRDRGDERWTIMHTKLLNLYDALPQASSFAKVKDSHFCKKETAAEKAVSKKQISDILSELYSEIEAPPADSEDEYEDEEEAFYS